MKIHNTKIPDKSTKSPGLGGEVFELTQATASAKSLTDMHVNDWPTGGNKISDVREMVQEASEIIANGSFEFKDAVFSGDQSGEMKVLGISWTPSTDTLRIDLNANVHEKKNGLKTGPVIDFSEWSTAACNRTSRSASHGVSCCRIMILSELSASSH